MNTERVHVLHVISDLHTGGAQSMLYQLLAHIQSERIQNTVVSLTNEGIIGNRIEALGIPVYYLKMRRGVPSPLGLLHLVRLLRDMRPFIVQSWLYHADLLGLLGGKIAGVPVILWNVRQSGMEMNQYKRLSRWVVNTLAWLSDIPTAVVVNSQAGQADHIRLGYHARRWVHIPNGFDLDHLHPDPPAREALRRELGLRQDAKLIGLIARYDPMKDHATFLEAAFKLLEHNPDVHLVLAGPDVDAGNLHLMQPIRASGKAAHFHLLGPRQDIPLVMAGLDICTSSSAFGEGFSNSIGEAMACGVPCVVTDVGDSAWIVGDTGRVVPPRDPAALAAAWQQVLDLPVEERAALGKAARERMEAEFDIRHIAKRYEALYLEFAGSVRV